VSRLLAAWRDGDTKARDELIPLVYAELRDLARRQMRKERPGHSLRPTALVNEVYLRLVQQRRATWQHREQFMAVAAHLMRRILVDHVRRNRYQKRGGDAIRIAFDEIHIAAPVRPDQLIALDEALDRLEQHDKRKAAVVELRYFGGLTVEETAAVLTVSPITVKRDWSMAKAWLHREMSRGADA